MNVRLSSTLLLVSLLSFPLLAQKAIQFDFGVDAGPYSGTISPAHQAGTLPLSETTWNAVTSDVALGLLFADGTPAPGVTFDVGQSATFTGPIDWNDQPLPGGDVGTSGIFATPLASDNFYTSSDRQLGARVRGLAPGTYRVYSIGRGTPDDQLGLSYVQTIDRNIDNQTATTPTIGPVTPPPTTWINGQTHLEATVTVTSPLDWVTVISRLDDPNSHSAHPLQGLQIVPVAAGAAVPALDERSVGLLGVLLAIVATITLRR